MSQPVILVDAMNLVFRQHFSHSHLSYEGKHTGVLFGCLKTIADLRENVSKNILVIWDHGIPVLNAQKPRNWREDYLPTYKATRSHDNTEWPKIVSQLQHLHDAIRLLGYSNVASMGLEADDVIGILSNEIPGEVLIFSSDKDFYQLLCDRVQILVPKKDGGKFQRITQADVEKEYGIPIWEFDKYLALGGDGCDNIKPLKGMGPKTAIKLVKAGAIPSAPWELQTKTFQKTQFKYNPVWGAIQKSYIAARIPRSRNDERFSKLNLDFSCLNTSYRQTFHSDEHKRESLEAFSRFCGNHNMVSLLAIRRQFFATDTTTREQLQCPPIPTESKVPLLPKRALPLIRKTLI